jgi:hypothetical protein
MTTFAPPLDAGATWWRPRREQPAAVARLEGSPIAFYALIAFTVVLLLSPQAWFPLLKLVRIAFLAAAIAAAAHVAERTVHKQPIMPMAPEIGIALALVCWSTITIPMSYWPGGSVRLLTDQYIKAITFFWLLATIISTPARLRAMAWALVLCSLPLAGTGLWHYAHGDVMSTGVEGLVRVVGYMGSSGLTGNPNDLALMLNLIVPIAGALAIGSRGIPRLIALGAILLSVGAIIVTFSRAGFLALATTFVMFLIVLVRRRSAGVAIALLLVALSSRGMTRLFAVGVALLSMGGVIITFSRAGFLALAATFFMFLLVLVRRKSSAAAIALLIAALAVPMALPKTYVERLSTITNLDQDKTGSAQGRYKDLGVALEVISHNPIIGVGLGQDMIALNQARGLYTWRSVHNVYLQYAVDLGIPGFVLFAWLHLLCFRSAWAVDRRAREDPVVADLQPIATGIQVSLIAFLVAAMFHPIAYQFYFFSIAGLAVALKNTCRAEIARHKASQGQP